MDDVPETTLQRLLRLSLVPLVLALGACAVGNRYDYSNAIGGVPVSGKGNIAVDVIDARPSANGNVRMRA